MATVIHDWGGCTGKNQQDEPPLAEIGNGGMRLRCQRSGRTNPDRVPMAIVTVNR